MSILYLGPCLSFAGDNRHHDVWGEHTSTYAKIVRQYESQASDVRPNIRVMRTAAGWVLYQRLNQLPLVKPLALAICTANARTGLESLGLAKLLDHKTADSWKCITPPTTEPLDVCICGHTANSAFDLHLHIHSQPLVLTRYSS